MALLFFQRQDFQESRDRVVQLPNPFIHNDAQRARADVNGQRRRVADHREVVTGEGDLQSFQKLGGLDLEAVLHQVQLLDVRELDGEIT